MNTASSAFPAAEMDLPGAAPADLAPTRPFYWSVRRELWENRSIYLAPLGVGAFALVALVIHWVTMPSHLPGVAEPDPRYPGMTAPGTYESVTVLMLAAAVVIGAFYCLEALNSERRDRSILFWKSLPVSDAATVLAKAAVPLVILPLLTFAVIVATQLVLLLLNTAGLLAQGQSAAPVWGEMQVMRAWPALLYAVAAISLWHAPVYGYLLLVSAWARRTAALWAVLPLLAIGLLEKLTMDTSAVASLVKYRLFGWHQEAFAGHAPAAMMFDPLAPLTPGRFLTTPALWIGLVLAAVFLAAAVRLRRYREPI